MAGKDSNSPCRWMKGNTIGSGSFGTVNLAMNTNSGELFVVKSAYGTGFTAIQNEAEILENSDSPWIVRCLGHDVTIENGIEKFNLFMEYMAGGSLSDLSANFGGSLHESVVRSYTREILFGLNYLHYNGIIHCDLKCKNVLLGSCGNIKLGDFGSARKLSSHSDNLSTSSSSPSPSPSPSSQPLCGTPLWMAPEVLRKEEQSFASDIWSLGCTIIEMATGIPPWSNKVSSPVGAIFKIACTDDMPDLPAGFSEDGMDFLRKCLQRDPKLRWSSEELLKHPFISGTMMVEEKYSIGSDSPTSILEVGLTELDWESEEMDSPVCVEFPVRLPFSTRSSEGEKPIKHRKDSCDMSVKWIVVRSG